MIPGKLKKSPIGFEKTQKATVAALGLRKVGATVVLPANASVRGMVFKVRHLVSVDGKPADSPAGSAALAAALDGT